MGDVRLFLLGPPRLELAGEPVHLQRRKALALLAYLALDEGPHSRDRLATLLSPNRDQSSARADLRRALSTLKQALGGKWVAADQETVSLPSDPQFWCDVDQFQQRLALPKTHAHPPDDLCAACLTPLTEAIDLYRADFMAGFTLKDSEPFDRWQALQTESLRRQCFEALERLIGYHRRQVELEAALSYARRWLALDPLQETAHRYLMQFYAQSGDRTAALRQYQTCLEVLEAELGVPPSEETMDLYEQIRSGALSRGTEPGERGAEAQGSNFTAAPLHELPAQLTPFVGRDEGLADIIARLKDPACRLLTLVGPGGVGKSRLAMQAAQHISAASVDSAAFRHGIYLVSLASLDSAGFLVSAIAEALNFAFYRDVEPRQQLLDYLREKVMLLILDNFEHHLAGVHLVNEILMAAPAVKILATSREILNLQGEWLYPVQGLNYPAGEALEEVELEDYQAIQLFSQCARRARPDFSLSTEQKGAIRICQLVEGMPLGIELATSWLKLFPSDKIAQEIEGSLDFLATSQRNIPARHQNMRAVFEHSWQLLSDEERNVFKRLAVFRGGFRQTAAAQVAEATLPILAGLAEKSLLQLTAEGRYHFHALLRQFAEEKLAADSQAKAQAQDRHSDYFLHLLHRQRERLQGQEKEAVLREMGEESENVRSAWQWALQQNKINMIAGALDSLYDFYYSRSWFQEGSQDFANAVGHLRPLVSQTDEAEIILARLLARQGVFQETLSHYDAAQDALQESLAIFYRFDVPYEAAFALNAWGNVAFKRGNAEEARQRFQESLAISEKCGHKALTGQALLGLGRLAQETGNYEAAVKYFQTCLAIFRGLNVQDLIGRALDALATTCFCQGAYTQAEPYYRESLAIFRRLGDQLGTALALGGLGWLAWHKEENQNLVEARRLFEESLAICLEIGYRSSAGGRLNMLGDLALAQGHYQEAQQRFQQALKLGREAKAAVPTNVALRGLAEAVLALEDYQAAKNYLGQALPEAMGSELLIEILDSIAIWATWLAKTDDSSGKRGKEKALDLLGFVRDHPHTWQRRRDIVEPLITELEAELPPEAVAAAREQSRSRDLWATAEEVLAELEV